jgi:hypothetical protein
MVDAINACFDSWSCYVEMMIALIVVLWGVCLIAKLLIER